jgi:hypothetical protein
MGEVSSFALVSWSGEIAPDSAVESAGPFFEVAGIALLPQPDMKKARA